jgi:UDP-glucose 4-epimerase
LQDYKIDAVIHFAGLKAVGESVEKLIEYYANNVQGTISLLEAMKSANVKTLVFSSSATVYGEPQHLPYDEDHPTKPMNPYGQSKLQVEQILRDLAISDPEWKIISLRYFNPVGAHELGLIGEDPGGIPNNLMPYVAKVAAGELPHLNVFGDYYETSDGTGERDYIHVVDLVEGHMASLSTLKNQSGMEIFNLGTGMSNSVLDIVSSFERISGQRIGKIITARRPGDLPVYYANLKKARAQLEWVAMKTLDDMCTSTWNWFKRGKNL